MLEKTLPKHLYALDFTTKHYRDLLSRLSIIDNEELFNQKKDEISKGIIEYFALSHQGIDLHITFQTCTIKKHFIDSTRSEIFDRMAHKNVSILIDILDRKEEFHPLPYLVSIPTEIRTKILQGYVNANESMETARHITRQQIDTIFSLDERDIIFFLRGKISVRYYTPPQKFSSGMDKRFSGESVESMEEMYHHYFPEGAWEELEPILGDVLAEQLNFSVIDNMTFTKTFIPVFRSMIEILLLDIVNEEDRERIEGQTGFILRQYFHEILLYTAKNLLGFVENRDKNAEAFVKYFADEVIIDANGTKIQKYAITDRRQQKWNYSSIVSVMMQHKQSKIRIAAQKEAIIVAQERVNESQHDVESEKNHKLEIIVKANETERLISENDTNILELKGQAADNIEVRTALKSEINKLHDLHAELFKMRKEHNHQLEQAKNRITNKMSELSQRHKKLDYEKKSLQTLIEQSASVKEMYEMITEAISLVLAKR